MGFPATGRRRETPISGTAAFARLGGPDEARGRGRVIIMGGRNSDSGAEGRTKLGLALEAGAREILAHVKGETRLPARRVTLPDEVDVKRIRTAAGMSQAEFATTRSGERLPRGVIRVVTARDMEDSERRLSATSRWTE